MVRRRVVPAGAGALGLAAAWWGPGAAAHSRPLARALDVALTLPADPGGPAAPGAPGDPRAPGAALTFDDGPHPKGTPAVLDALARSSARATFFVVGEQAQRYPVLVAEIMAAGHEVAVHGYRHRCQLRLGPRTFAADLERAVAVIGDLCGRPPAWYRPPYGAFTLGGLVSVRRSGLRPLLWSRWGRDWDTRTAPETIAALATRQIGAGDVVLLHDADWYSSPGSWRHTVAALPEILSALAERGLAAVAAPRPAAGELAK